MFAKKRPLVSFEIFPPKKDYPISTIYETIEALKDLKPDFISVTYGAGGSSKNNTIEIASVIKNNYNIEALAHLTCIGASKVEIQDTIESLKNKNIQNILALRGDFPKNIDLTEVEKLEYQYAKDLVTDIRKANSFSIGAATYPEGHTDSDNIFSDIRNLKEKVDTGVDFLITQLFFDNEIFYDFLEKLEKNNITTPVIAGIMPILNKNQIEHIVQLSGASLPKKFMRILDKYGDSPAALKEAGTAYATEQIIDLLSSKIDGIHIYTMNKPDATRRIMENITQVRKALA